MSRDCFSAPPPKPVQVILFLLQNYETVTAHTLGLSVRAANTPLFLLIPVQQVHVPLSRKYFFTNWTMGKGIKIYNDCRQYRWVIRMGLIYANVASNSQTNL